MRCKGRTAIVTGGGRGIGRGIAMRLAQEGADIAVFDLDLDTAQEVAGKARAAGRRTAALQVDVADRQAVSAAVRRVKEELGQVDILVNNAGWSAPPTDFAEMEVALWKKIVDVDLFGVLNCTRAALDYMVPQKYGRIISIISDAGRMGSPGFAVYAGAKAGVAGFSRALAAEVAKYGITVNCVSPSSIETPMLRYNVGEEGLAQRLRLVPTGRLGKPEDIANAVAFLAADESEYVTGQTISVNGGKTRFA